MVGVFHQNQFHITVFLSFRGFGVIGGHHGRDGRVGFALNDFLPDAERQQRFIDLLLQECQANGSALLFVSHDMRLADHFDRLLHLPELNRAVGDAS